MIDKLLDVAVIFLMFAVVAVFGVLMAVVAWETWQTAFAPRRVCLEAQSEQVWREVPRGGLQPATRVTCLRWEGQP